MRILHQELIHLRFEGNAELDGRENIATLTALAAAADVIAAAGAGSPGKSPEISAHIAPPARTAGRGTRANQWEIDYHPLGCSRQGVVMADVGCGGVVVVARPHYRSRGLCTCGWVDKPHLLLSSAKLEALIHAARHNCEPAVPLIRRGVTMIMVRRGILDGDRPRGAALDLETFGEFDWRGFHRRLVAVNYRRFHRQRNCWSNAAASVTIGSLPYGIFTGARLFRKSGTVT